MRKPSTSQPCRDVAASLKAMGYDPIEGLANIAANPDAAMQVRRKAFRDLSHIVLPAKRAFEILLRLAGAPRAEELLR